MFLKNHQDNLKNTRATGIPRKHPQKADTLGCRPLIRRVNASVDTFSILEAFVSWSHGASVHRFVETLAQHCYSNMLARLWILLQNPEKTCRSYTWEHMELIWNHFPGSGRPLQIPFLESPYDSFSSVRLQGFLCTKKAFFKENPFETAFFSTMIAFKKALKGNQWEGV